MIETAWRMSVCAVLMELCGRVSVYSVNRNVCACVCVSECSVNRIVSSNVCVRSVNGTAWVSASIRFEFLPYFSDGHVTQILTIYFILV